ncbi:MAG: NosD domain-containing protein [Methanospirillum sp.]
MVMYNNNLTPVAKEFSLYFDWNAEMLKYESTEFKVGHNTVAGLLSSHELNVMLGDSTNGYPTGEYPLVVLTFKVVGPGDTPISIRVARLNNMAGNPASFTIGNGAYSITGEAVPTIPTTISTTPPEIPTVPTPIVTTPLPITTVPPTLPPLVAASPAPGYEIPIVVRDADQMDPALYGSRIVWQDWRNDDDGWNKFGGDIYSYNLSSHIDQAEGASSSAYHNYGINDFDPIVSDNGIFWVYDNYIGYGTINSILGRSLTGEPIGVTGVPRDGSSMYIQDLAIDGNRLIYVLSTDPDWSGNFDYRLILYDTATRYIYTIRETANEIRSPDIYGNNIVWQEYDGSSWNIRRYSLTGGSVETLSFYGGDQVAPVIDGTTVIWADNSNGNWDLHSCDLSVSYPLVIPWLVAAGDQTNPQISGDRVVWQDNRNGNWDIYMGSLSGGTVATVCIATGDQESPAVDGNRIVWQDKRNWNWDIYMFTVTSTTPVPVPTPASLVITSPGTYSIAADGYDGRITPIEIHSSNVILDGGGHTIDGSGQSGISGIRIVGGGGLLSNIVVRNVRLTNWETGISADGITGSVIEALELAHNRQGIALEDAQNVQVRDNRISAGDVTGIKVTDSGNTIIQENEVLHMGGGFSFVTGESIPVSIDDVQIIGSSGTRLSDNDLGGDYTSVELSDSISTRITGNQLTGRNCGIHANGDDAFVVNNVFKNHYGIYGVLSDAPLNTTPLPGPNIVGGPQIGGNFWANLEGTGFSETHLDTNGDGFCDEAYYNDMGGVDQLPLAPWAGPAVMTVPGGSGLPADTNTDGLYDDVNGNGRNDFADVVLYFNQVSWISANEPVAAFDYNGNGRIDFADVVWLFNNL